MSTNHDLLIEIGTEELPPLALRRLAEAFRSGLDRLLTEHHLAHGESYAWASPRRLAVQVAEVPRTQPDREVVRRGPNMMAAFDEEGRPTKPAEGFARSCGVAVQDLDQLETDKGSFLAYRAVETGKAAGDVIPALVEQALKALPVPKRMRWGDSDVEFVRPVHWVLLLHGADMLPAEILGVRADRYTRGHRFHCNEPIEVAEPAVYLETLKDKGHHVDLMTGWFEDYRKFKQLTLEETDEQTRYKYQRILNGLYLALAGLIFIPLLMIMGK